MSQELRAFDKLRSQELRSAAARDLAFIREVPYFRDGIPFALIGAEDDATMAEFEMPIEEQLRSLSRRFGAVETKLESIDSKLETIDSRLDSVDSRLDSVDSRLDSVDARLDSVDAKLHSMDSRLGSMESHQDSMEARQNVMESRLSSMDSKLSSMDSKLDSMSVRLDDTRQLAKLGLEAAEGLRESNDKAHLQMRRDHEKQIDLLKALGVHVRKRVERLERPKRRS